MKEFLPVLKKSPLFSGIEEAEIEAMTGCLGAETRTYQKDELVYRFGDTVESPALEVLRHAESRGIATLDLATRFVEANRADPSLFERWFEGHMTREGNRWAAEQIADALRALR